MGENNKVYEVLNTMRDTSALQRDLMEAFDTAKGKLREKYIDRLRDGLREQHCSAQQSPPREARLLETMKLFLPAERHEAVSKLADAFCTIDVCRKRSGQYAALTAQSIPAAEAAPAADSSVHDDGVYDLDAQCVRKQGSRTAAAPPAAALLLMLLSERRI